jgi:hypothetical protein
MVNFLNSMSATLSPAAGAGAEDPISTSIAAERLRLAPASPPLGDPAGAAAAAAATVEGDLTWNGSRDPFAQPGLQCCDPGEGPSLRDGGLRFLAGKNCGSHRG